MKKAAVKLRFNRIAFWALAMRLSQNVPCGFSVVFLPLPVCPNSFLHLEGLTGDPAGASTRAAGGSGLRRAPLSLTAGSSTTARASPAQLVAPRTVCAPPLQPPLRLHRLPAGRPGLSLELCSWSGMQA